MEKGTIPPHLNFEKEREGMHLAARNIKVGLEILLQQPADKHSFLYLESHFLSTQTVSDERP